MLKFLQGLLFDNSLMSHGYCYLWKTELVGLHVASDSLITLSYYAISIMLIYFAQKRRDVPFDWIFMMFGTFMIVCGTSHLMEIWTLWYPSYWLSGSLKAITALVSCYTAWEMLRLLPRALELASPAQVEETNQILLQEVVNVKRAEREIRQLNGELEERVKERTAALQQTAESLKTEVTKHEKTEEELRLLQSLTQAISDAEDFDSALSVALRRVCEVTGWDYGEAWIPRTDNTVIECSPAWYASSPQLESFRQASVRYNFEPNVGLPGRVWTSHQPMWIADVSVPVGNLFTRAKLIQASGLKAGFGVPILSGNQVLAVLTFFMMESRTEEQRQVELVTFIAAQLGFVMQRKQLESERDRLATFPQLDPNPIVEMDLIGKVHYVNPEAARLFPDLENVGVKHPFLAQVPLIAAARQHQSDGSLRQEVKIGEIYFQQVVHYVTPTTIRVYAFDISDRKRAEAQLIHNAFYDPLTQLPNRALFMDRLGQATRRAKDQPTEYLFAVLFLDLDRFKVVNDSLGHLVGDQLLQHIARTLKDCLRLTDTVARLGGDEFAILLEGIREVREATYVADRIHQALSQPYYLDRREVFTTVSIGIALSTNGFDYPEDLLRDADMAMYRAKGQGRACYEVFDMAMHAQAVASLQLEMDLRRAVERQEFIVYYQPIVSLATGKVKGFEALVRWQHPERGLISPSEFIPLAEETGLIVVIDLLILKEACRQLRIWQHQFPSNPPLSVNVNLSGKQFSQPDLLEQIDLILGSAKLEVGSLKLEITESVISEKPDLVTALLRQLQKRDIKLCIDDFGTGFSSLSRLHNFPINTLKIDRSFISRIGALGENSEIVRTIVTLAQNLDMDVVAEGVEMSDQVTALIALECEYGQGYFFSRPMNPEAAEAMLLSESTRKGGKTGVSLPEAEELSDLI